MASSGKKGKKMKGKTIAWNAFVGDAPPLPPPTMRSSMNWADETDDVTPLPAVQKYLPTAPRAARGSDVDEARIPKDGPFVAYIFNLLYDVEEKDISDFFIECNVANIRLPRDDRSGKLKGFGYVEFTDRASLLTALQLSEQPIKGRRIRIEIADSNDRDNRRGGMNRDRDRDRDRDSNYDPDRTMGDWRSGPRPESAPMDRGPRRDFGSRDMDRDRDRDRDRDDRDGGGNWRDAPRRPPMGDEREREREGRSGFGPNRRFGPRDSSPPPEGRVRPKLDLKPRTLPVESLSLTDGDDKADGEAEQKPAKTSSNPFGNAKPVDTASREREITSTKDNDVDSDSKPTKPPAASPFGGAKPVDTSAREREIAEKLESQKPEGPARDSRDRGDQDDASLKRGPRSVDGEENPPAPRPAKPSAASIFGSAKPVDTAQREREIEERLAKGRIDGPKSTENRDRSEDEDRKDEKTEKSEPAPPPKENAWEKRAQRIDPPARSSSPNRESRSSPPPRDRRDDNSRDRDRYPPRRDDRDRGSYRDSDRDRDYPRRDRDDRDYPRRDREDRDRRRDDDKDYSRRDRDVDRDYNRRDGERRNDRRRDGDRDRREPERDSRDRGLDGERSRDNNLHSDKERGGSGSRAPPRDAKDKPPREPRPPREMPKAAETVAPNYAATNKYSFLEEDAPAE